MIFFFETFFYIIALFLSVNVVFFSFKVINTNSPIYSVLYLIATSISLTFLFFLIKAFFMGYVILLIYIGAVIVLLLFILMLFSSETEIKAYNLNNFFSKFQIIGVTSVFSLMFYKLIYDSYKIFLSVLTFTDKEIIFSDFLKYFLNIKYHLGELYIIGHFFYVFYMPYLLLVALLLLVAMIGAVFISQPLSKGIKFKKAVKYTDRYNKTKKI